MTQVIDYFLFLACIFMLGLCVLWVIHLYSRNSWFCLKMDWHPEPLNQGHDGVNVTGRCPRCKKEILRDYQGNWFRSNNDG